VKNRVRVEDRIGQRFGRLVITAVVSRASSGAARVTCKCDCGLSKVVQVGHLVTGNIRSCGCFRKEAMSSFAKARFTTHGGIGSREYRTWDCMLQRCTNTSLECYASYGGRGISVCESWKSFENFYADMGPRPDGCSLDRIDNNGNYCKENCRWATRKEQSRNTSRNVVIEHNGKSQTLTDWAEESGIHKSTLTYRLRSGWPIEKALTAPPGVR